MAGPGWMGTWEAVMAGQRSRDQAEQWDPCGSRGGEMFKHCEKKRGAKVTRCRRKTGGCAEQQGDGGPSVPGLIKAGGEGRSPQGQEDSGREEKHEKSSQL